VKTASLARFAKCRKPFAVEKSTVDQVAVGSGPIVSSVPGPRSSIASNRRSASRAA
jgi:hypothetical protein